MPDHHRLVKGIIAFLLCIVLSACGGPNAAVTPQTPEKSTAEIRTPTEIPATWKPSSTFTPTIQPTGRTKATLRPSHTPTWMQPTSTVPIDAGGTLTEEALDLRDTQIAGFPATCDFTQNDHSLSPGGSWLAISCGYSHDQTMEIKNKKGTRWVLQFKDYLADEFTREGGTPMGNLYPAHWTSDEKYLYFASYIAFDGGGTCFYGFGVQGLYRIDLNSGLVATTLASRSSWDGYHFAFSPGGRRLAYSAGHPAVMDLQTGQTAAIDADTGFFGNLTWSPDGSRLAYAACQTTPDGLEVEKSSIQIYSLETRTSKTILAVEGRQLSILAGDENTLLKIADTDDRFLQTKYSFFDWSSENLFMVTPTPGT